MSTPRGSRIAVVGSGISGLVAAHHLRHDFDLTVFEAGSYIGGHTNTVDVDWQGRTYAIDTGFIVFNDRTYPNFIALLDDLKVASQPSDMSFSVKCSRSGIEYCGTSLNTIFAQRRNALRPSFLWMLREILRFNRESLELLDSDDDRLTLGDYLARRQYSKRFVDQYIVPMGAAIWSASPDAMAAFPAQFFVRFFRNHGMLSIDDRPTWRVVRGGSREYVRKLTAPFRDRIHVDSPIRRIHRHPDRVTLELMDGRLEDFAGVVIATHSNTALQLLARPTPEECQILDAIPYQHNDATLHVDERFLPKTHRAWAAWNYHVPAAATQRVAVTYNMNILQGIDAPVQFLVSLNADAKGIAEDKVLRRIRYQHPIFTAAGVAAQQRHAEISGVHRTWYCGAYWGFGFHEDGVKSGLRVVEQLRTNLAAPRGSSTRVDTKAS